MLRVLLYLFLIPLLLLVIAALTIPLFLDTSKLLPLATEALERRTGATLEVSGDAHLSLFPHIALELGQASLVPPGEHPPQISARSLAVGVQLLPLFSRQVEIEGLEAEGLTVTLPPAPSQSRVDTSTLSDAQLDAYYQARRAALGEAGARGVGGALALPLSLGVEQLSLRDATIVLQAEDGAAPTVIDLATLRAHDLNTQGRPTSLRLALSVPRPSPQAPLSLALETTLTLDARGQQLQLDDLRATLEGLTAEPLTLAANGSADLARQSADLALETHTGEAHGEGTLRYAALQSPQIDAELHFNQLSPALLALAGPDAAASGTAAPPAGEEDGDRPLPLDALRQMDTRAHLRVDSATVDGHEITGLEARLRAVDGVLKVSQLEGQVHGGALAMTATVDARHSRARLESEGSLRGVDLPRLLAALEAPPQLTGSASLDWQLRSRGASTHALRDHLEGPIRIHAQDLVARGIGIERMLCQAVALANRESLTADLPEDSAFEAFTADIQVADGRARLAPLRAELPDLALTGTGAVSLATLDFKAEFDTRLEDSLAQLDPACHINKRYTAIDWPLVCKGQLGGEPGDWCSVDSGAIIEELTRNEVERKVQKEAGRLFDKLLNREQD
jgi:AsmA protein